MLQKMISTHLVTANQNVQLEWMTAGDCKDGMHEVVVTSRTVDAIKAATQENRSLWRVSSTILNPWIQVKSLAYLKQENLRTRFFFHVQRLAEDDLIDEQGNPNFKAFEIDTPMKMEKPKASIMYVIFSIGVIYLISGAFIQSVIQFSNVAHVPFLFISFVMAPIAMNASMVITTLLNAGPHVSKNASLTFSEIYSGLVMNNLLGLSTLLVIVYIKGLSWSYSAEVLTIMIPCAIVGLFAFKRCTYPLWASIIAMLLYPISVYLYYVLDS